MRIIKTKKINVVSGQVLTLELCDNGIGSTVVGEVDIQTATNIPFSVSASVDGTNYTAHKVVDIGNFELKTNVTNAGHYLLPAAGLHSAKITFLATGEVFIKEVF